MSGNTIESKIDKLDCLGIPDAKLETWDDKLTQQSIRPGKGTQERIGKACTWNGHGNQLQDADFPPIHIEVEVAKQIQGENL